VPSLAGVDAVAGGAKHALALLDTGRVVAWGSNASGGLGGPSSEVCQQVPCSTTPQPVNGLSAITAVSAGFGFSLALDVAGKVYSFGDNQWGKLGDGTTTDSQVPVAVGGLAPVSQIVAGEQNSLALIPSGLTPPPLMTLRPMPEALELAWTFRSEDYELRYTPFDENAWSPTVSVLEGQPHRYLFSGLSVKPYEVNITTDEKTRYVVGTPLP
jgi:regulator of chromosome condensation (RCC1) repeat-containing protein/Regulator of Chromosome Condensation (RCC1) repeat protein